MLLNFWCLYSTPADKIEYGKFTTPICNSTDTTLSAFKLINALCMGCVENIKTLQGLLNDLFYSGTHYSGFLVFSLEGGEKSSYFSIIGLKCLIIFILLIRKELYTIVGCPTEI